MSFAAPLVLLGLLAVPVLAILYARYERARRRVAAAFAAPALAPSVAPQRPGWRRHAPVGVVAVAVAVLVLAAARPQTTVAVPVEHASIMLLNDVSGSMQATDVAPSRLVAARNAAQRFVDQVPRQVNVGIMAFNHAPTVLQSPTQDRAAISAALGRLTSHGGTAAGDAVQLALRVLHRPAAIVLLSDGASKRGVDPVKAAQAAGRLKIPIYTVALGTQNGTITVPRKGGGVRTQAVPPDAQSLGRMADASGGRAYTAAAASRLSDVYARLGSQLGRRNAKHEITAGFAGGALALLALGAAMSLRWFGRLI